MSLGCATSHDRALAELRSAAAAAAGGSDRRDQRAALPGACRA